MPSFKVTDGDLTIVGTVTLDLQEINNYASTVADGDQIKIIDIVTVGKSVTGTFVGFADGAFLLDFLGSGLNAIIDYQGGDGNDVVLSIQANVAPVVDLNGANGGVDHTIEYVEQATAATVTTTDATVSDLESTELTGLSLVVSSNPDGADETVTVAGVAFPLNADKTDTATVGATLFEVAYTAATLPVRPTPSPSYWMQNRRPTSC